MITNNFIRTLETLPRKANEIKQIKQNENSKEGRCLYPEIM